MAPTKGSKGPKKPLPSLKASAKAKPLPRKSGSATAGSKSKVTKPPPKQQKTKPGIHNPKPGKKRVPVYTDKQLGLQSLNSIVPVSHSSKAASGKGTGKKTGKVFVDDVEAMQTIMSIVNAEKDGIIESKMIKMRRLEEIREARQKEQEKRDAQKRNVLEGKMEEVKGKRKRKGATSDKRQNGPVDAGTDLKSKKKKKSVAFA
jgi:60S ribosomal subunit assembly/export protein LOC1